MKIIRKILPLLTIFALQLVFVSSTYSASYRTCDGKKQTWAANQTGMYLSTISFPPGGSWDRHTQDMISQWNTVGGSNFKFNAGRDTNGTVRFGNYQNEAYFLNEPKETHLGVTKIKYACSRRSRGYREADISINARYSWTTSSYSGAVNLSPYSFDTVMLHELGHALGLVHYNGRPAKMNAIYPHAGTNGHFNLEQPHADDRYGLSVLYPGSSTDRDLSVSRFFTTGDGETYKNAVSTISGVRITRLKKGSQYKIKYTMENLGTRPETAQVRFYMSTNSYISTGDIYLGSTTWNMPATRHVTAEKTVTIPNNIASRNYYIGYIVDAQRSVPESNEYNNFVSYLSPLIVN